MSDTRGRRPRGRKKVRYEEILPSTDLPPLVQGDLRCFLIVDVGRIFWSSTATAQVPPASPAYVRLRWWGETSDGTLFKPHSNKNEKVVKCRCRFGIRSGAKQMSAYFVDMGSIVFEVLTSPKSVPLGRIQIPKVAHLSSSNPIRDFFPIYSPSSRKIGELEIHIRFKSLEGAYDLTTDTGTDTSMSSRSRPASEVGRRSRSRGSSAGSISNRGSARSRSSSVGSKKSGRKKRSTSRSKGRRRSRSTESNASSASKVSHSVKKGSTVESSTPRGIDDLLQQNGHNLYGLESNPTRSKSVKIVEKEEETAKKVKGDGRTSLQQDAISVLLQRGNQLREDILKSQFDANLPKTHTADERSKPVVPLFEATVNPKPLNKISTGQLAALPTVLKPPKLVTPIKEKRQDLDMRFVDLVFGSHEFKNNAAHFSGIDSHSVSPLSSMISEFEDNPLYDESLLQQMFYNNGPTMPVRDVRNVNEQPRDGQNVESSDTKVFSKNNPSSPQKENQTQKNLVKRIPGMSVQRLSELQGVHCVTVTIETLALNQHDTSLSKTRVKKGRGRGGKPPVPSPKGKQKTGTYFVEFHLPEAASFQRKHPSSIKTSHDVTRVASRRSTAKGGPVIVFDECCEFQFRFNEANLIKWGMENLEFDIYHRKPNDKKASLFGSAAIELRDFLTSNDLEFSFDVDVSKDGVICGSLKVTMEFIALAKPNDRSSSLTDILDDNIKENEPDRIETETTKPAQVAVSNKLQDNGLSIALSPLTSILYMMTMVHEGYGIPGTTVISPRQGMVTHPPNVSLVCRTLTSGESEKTPIVWGHSNPKFDFVQVSPLKLDHSLLSRMRNNFVIVEVWTRITSTEPNSDKLLGLAKLPTHHFYQSLNDQEISRVVLKSLHPLVSVDELVPIVDLFTGEQRGQLNVTLAVGTQTQISTLRKVKLDIQGKRVRHHHMEDDKKPAESESKMSGPVEHIFEVNIVKLNEFKPQDNQVWGETDCFVKYKFPTQKVLLSENLDMDGSEESENLNLATMADYRTDATLCIPDPVFNDARRHSYTPPPSVPLQRILLSCCYGDGVSGGIPFELWSRYYHPNTRDQVLAKGMLPIAKLGALVTMTKGKVSEQTFDIPLEFVDMEYSHDGSAGKLEVHVKYKALGTTMESVQPPMKFNKPVILRVGLLRACGLKTAAGLVCRHSNSGDLKYCADVGVNTYVEMKPSFLPDEETRTSRIVAQSFAPEYQHHVEIACPLVSYHRDITPVSLAELLLSGEMEITVWHRAEDGGGRQDDDVLLATLTIPMRSLLHKTTGVHTWYPLKAPEKSRISSDDTLTVGGLELSMTFSSPNDLDLILKAAKATGWSLPPFESRLLNDGTVNWDVTGNDKVTFSVTVTNAWLPKHEVLLHGRSAIDKNANVYIRYKFFDHDSVTSSLCGLASKQPHCIDARFENLTSARIAHKRSFICKKSRPLNWYLREEKLELQLWLTHSAASKKSRPLDSDKLLGACYLDLSTISNLEKEQHISGSFNIYKAAAEDLAGGHARVYVSMKPGDIADPVPDPIPAEAASESDASSALETQETTPKSSAKTRNEASFLAVVTVERGMHLPLVGDLETDKPTEPNSFVSYEVVDEVCAQTEELKMVSIVTRISIGAQSPSWNDAKEVSLPRHLLTGSHGALLLKVWHRDRLYLTTEDSGPAKQQAKGTEVEMMATDRMLGFATIDLSVLRAGLRDVNGWYNILDIHGQCQGQMKVAVTPKDSEVSQPSSARSCESSQKSSLLSAPKIPNFLHQSPIDVPVQTPSGSVYVPGLQTACGKMSKNSGTDYLSKTREEIGYTRNFHEDFSNRMRTDDTSSTSMFRYVDSDRHQASLVNTLEKQISELESIKKKFEERRAGGFGRTAEIDSVASHRIQSDSKPEGHRENLNGINGVENGQEHTSLEYDSHSFKPPNEGRHEMNQPVVTLMPECDSSESEGLEKRQSSQPQNLNQIPLLSGHPYQCDKPDGAIHLDGHSGTQTRSVHLSLYDPKRNADFHDRAMSDNEANSDLEFVQPRSLNESFSSDLVEKIPEAKYTMTKPPHSEVKNHKPPEATVNAPIVTPGRSEGHSVLEDTSLWLTGSSFRVSGFSSDEERDKMPPKPKETQKHSNTHTPASSRNISPPPVTASSHPSFEDERSISPLEEVNHEENHDAFNSSSEDAEDPERENPDPHDKKSDAAQTEADEERCHSPALTLEDVPNVLHDSDDDRQDPHITSNDVEAHRQNPIQAEINGFQEDGGSEHVAEEAKKSIASDDEHQESNDPSRSQNSKTSSPRHGSRKESSSDNSGGSSLALEDENQSNEEGPIADETPVIPNKPLQPHPSSCKESLSELSNDENRCPNFNPGEKQQTKSKRLHPTFFPPSQNLEASMRALQEATLKHKHELLKRKEASDNTEQISSAAPVRLPSARPKKLPPKPADYPDEKTRRLARIFRTKFSS